MLITPPAVGIVARRAERARMDPVTGKLRFG